MTVNQNLLQVQQVPRKPSRFSIDLNRDGDTSRVGEFSIDASRVTAAQRLPFVAAALGGESGNIVYANGPGTSERYANILFDILGSDADRSSPVLDQAAELIRGTVHPRFSLASIIRRGIGFTTVTSRCQSRRSSRICSEKATCSIWSARRRCWKASTYRVATSSSAGLRRGSGIL